MKLVTFDEALASGKPFRHYKLKPTTKYHPEIWFKPLPGGLLIHVLGPDDIVPLDEAIPAEWRDRKLLFEIQEDPS